MDGSDQSPLSDPAHTPEDDQIILRMAADQINPTLIQSYLSARRWRENHIDERPLGYADPVLREVMRREDRTYPWNADTAKAAVTLSNGMRVLVTGLQLTVLLESVTRTYPLMKSKKILRTLTLDELRAVLNETVA